MITCELKENFAEVRLVVGVLSPHTVLTCPRPQVARNNLEYAGVASKVKVLIGPAAETLQTLPSDEKFDFAFIDADKASNLTYFLQAKRLVRRGGVIVCPLPLLIAAATNGG